MNVTRFQQGRVAVLALHGAILAADLDIFDKSVKDLMDVRLTRIVFDFKQVPFIDSAGLERLLSIASEVTRSGGDVRVAGLNDVCRDIFEVTRLDSFVFVFEDRDSAVRSML